MIFEGSAHTFGRDVDTDVIIPARYLNSSDPAELGAHCMEDIDADFVARVRPGDIIVAAENFGCGSSREHAAWALLDRGFHAVIAPSFARIFLENAYNNGVAPIVVDASEIDQLLASKRLTIDLDDETVTREDGRVVRFTLDPLRKEFLLSGGYMSFMASRVEAVRSWLASRTAVTAG
jgi:3-isopropylmalate/(R)-2-methylmalate dehydratase small subunit